MIISEKWAKSVVGANIQPSFGVSLCAPFMGPNEMGKGYIPQHGEHEYVLSLFQRADQIEATLI